MKKKEICEIISHEEIALGIRDLWIRTELAKEAHAGQFVGVYTGDPSMMLPRPISICEVSDDFGALRLVYRIAGKGTEAISKLRPGGTVEVLGNLGNGYEFYKIASVMKIDPESTREPSKDPAQSAASDDSTPNSSKDPAQSAASDDSTPNSSKNPEKSDAPDSISHSVSGASEMSDTDVLLTLMDQRFLLLGGGIGIPPMLEAAKELKAHGCEPVIVAGYRDSILFLDKDLEKYGTLYIATEDGSVGTKGNVLDVVRSKNLAADVIFACGPMPMLRAIAGYAEEETGKGRRTEAFLSLEERMACGVGACLGCVVKTKETDPHSHVKNARICTEGPVFRASELDLS